MGEFVRSEVRFREVFRNLSMLDKDFSQKLEQITGK